MLHTLSIWLHVLSACIWIGGTDAKLDRMNDRILSMTRWLIGLVGLFGTLVTVLLAVAQFGG
jgi:hypothetical protein